MKAVITNNLLLNARNVVSAYIKTIKPKVYALAAAILQLVIGCNRNSFCRLVKSRRLVLVDGRELAQVNFVYILRKGRNRSNKKKGCNY